MARRSPIVIRLLCVKCILGPVKLFVTPSVLIVSAYNSYNFPKTQTSSIPRITTGWLIGRHNSPGSDGPNFGETATKCSIGIG